MSISSKIVLDGMKKELPQIKIIEAFKPEVIHCESKEDFIEILNLNKDKYNQMSTQKLNKIFIVPGYKLTKIKGEICLRSIKPCEKIETHTNYEEEIQNIKNAFNQLSDQLEYIKQLLNLSSSTAQ